MVAGLTQREVLSSSLFALANKDPRRFEDILWLAYGDDWTVVRRNLAGRGIIEYVQSDDTHRITDQGRAVLGALRRAGHGVERAESAGR